MNVVVWARVSSREQREGYSIDAQLRVNRDRAKANGWNVVREFVVAESARGAGFGKRLEFIRVVLDGSQQTPHVMDRPANQLVEVLLDDSPGFPCWQRAVELLHLSVLSGQFARAFTLGE